MINVAIVEDEDSQAQVLYEYIERYSRESGSKYSYKRFRDGYEFIENYRQEFGVVLLDINMPHLNGMDAAVMLREKDKNVSIVFITSLVQFALRGYEVDAVS
ncbi:MAG: response regulator, partial [Oscillospiraceae bacterium]|nr:response regulator [Oscillospiraceae bacterium]